MDARTIGQTDIKLKFRWVQRAYGNARFRAFRAHSGRDLQTQAMAALVHLRPELGVPLVLQALRDSTHERLGVTTMWEPIGPVSWSSDPARIEELLAVIAADVFEMAIQYQS